MGDDALKIDPGSRKRRPPRLGRWWLGRILPAPWIETVAGDYEEIFARILASRGPRKADIWYWHQLLTSTPPLLKSLVYWRLTMTRNYLRLAFRNMGRRPGLTAVNLGGMALGFAGCALVLFFLRDEASFDRFHEGIDRIYEVRSKVQLAKSDPFLMETQGPVGPMIAAEYPEVEAAARLAKTDVVVRNGENVFLQRGLGAEPSFFRVFTFPMERGNAATALASPDSVVLTAAAARRCFGSKDPMGQTLSLYVEGEAGIYKVGGIVRDLPPHSSLVFDMLLPIARVKGPAIDRWESAADAACFIRLRKGTESADLEAKFSTGLDRQSQGDGSVRSHYLFPLADYHRGVREYPYSSVLAPRGAPAVSAILAVIALLVLAIAGFNSVNLGIATAAAERIKEIGVRKVLGAQRGNLFHQYAIENLVTNLIALSAGLAFASLVLPAFNRFTGKALRLDLLGPGWPLFVLILIAILLSPAAGSIPAGFLSRFRPTDLFQGRILHGRKNSFSRALLVLQFGTSMALIIVTGFLYFQHRYLRRSDLGFMPQRVVVLNLDQGGAQTRDASHFLPALKMRLSRRPEIRAVSGAYSEMSSMSARIVKPHGASAPEIVRFNEVDPGYLSALGLRLKEGSWFANPPTARDRDGVIVNEAFVRRFCGTQALGRALSEFFPMKSPARIIGIVRDFHFDSLRQTVQPAMMTLGEGEVRKVFIRLGDGDIRSALDLLKNEVAALAPEFPFLPVFLEDEVARQYEDEARWSLMISIVSLFVVLIALAGVFALAVKSMARRTKEIGIRRVLGASTIRLVWLMDAEFVGQAAAACLLAWPIAYFVGRRFLFAYPYRIALSPWFFLAGGGLVAVLALATVSFEAFRSVRPGPAEMLRYE